MNEVQFININQGAQASNNLTFLSPFDVSALKVYTIAVINEGTVDVEVQVEISPNNINYVVDRENQIVSGGDMMVFVPQIFLQFLRLSVKTIDPGTNAILSIFLQGQK